MKRKAFVILIAIMALIVLTSCKPETFVDSYTIEKGREVFIPTEYYSYNQSEEIHLPDSVIFEGYLGDGAYLVSAIVNTTSEDDEIYRYGLANKDGLVLPCEYESLSKSGRFLNFTRTEESGDKVNEIYFIDGVLLLEINGSVTIDAINDDYCTLYYDSYSQVFDKDGVYYFAENTMMSSNFSYSYCDGHLLGQDASRGDWFIWTLSKKTGDDGTPQGVALIDSAFTSSNGVNTLCYLGNEVFLVVESNESNSSNYTYYEDKDGVKRYVLQNAYTIDLTDGYVEIIDLEYPILGILNKYTPSMSYEQRASFNVREGYSAVSVAVLGEDLKRVGLRYYVIDSDCNFVLRYHEGISPSAISFIDGYGFVGMANAGYGCGLYYMNCELMWLNQEHEYFAQSYSYGRYVCGYATADGNKYGAFDSDGSIVVSFDYDYVSPYSVENAIAQKGDDYYLIDINGQIIRKLDDFYNDITPLSFGIYVYESDGHLGIKNFTGDILVKAENDNYVSVERHNGELYVCFERAEKSVLYKVN